MEPVFTARAPPSSRICLVMLIPLNLYIYIVQLRYQQVSMENVSISELRARLLEYLTRVQQGEQINVTSKGKVLATLSPPLSQQDAAAAKLAALANTAVIHDVLSPIDERWDALQ